MLCGTPCSTFAKFGFMNMQLHLSGETERTLFSIYGTRRNFHTTSSRHVNPMVFIFLKQVVRTASLITGRKLRTSWTSLSKERQQYLIKNYFLTPHFWLIPFGIIAYGGRELYVKHLQTTPVTNRNRFILFNDKQVMKICDMMSKLSLNRETDTKNMDIERMKTQKWNLHVVDKNIEDAFALANGHIFIYTGLLKVIKNDQLAFILGHEMAHSILDHTAETLTFSGIITLLTAIVLSFTWLILPNALAIFMQSIHSKMLKAMLDLPYSRRLELEADEVGLEFIAKCYVRENNNLWKSLSVVSNHKKNYQPSFLSSHPTYEQRAQGLNRLMSTQLKEAEGKIIEPADKVHIKVWNIIEKLIKINDVEKVKSQELTLHSVDKDVQNAFVLPNGHIFVYTGLLKITSNDDQLEFILGHEMAHAVLSHGGRKT